MLPQLTELQVYQKMNSTKKCKSFVKGDLHPKLISSFNVEIAHPASVIFNSITDKQEYPNQWKVEYGTIIPKTYPPELIDNTRVISKTAYLSKIYESFLVEWLLSFIGKFIDTAQYGGFKGLSTTHYLINFMDFVLGSLDNIKPTAVIAAFIDLSKAFNRIDHNLLIEDLYHMECPAWL